MTLSTAVELDLTAARASVEAAVTDRSKESLADLLSALNVMGGVLTDLRQLQVLLELEVAGRAKRDQLGDRVEVAGLVAEIHRSKTRRGWDNDALKSKWLTTYVDASEGDMDLLDPAALLEAFMRVARPSWKVTGLRDVGIDVSDFCDETPGAPSVRIVSAEAAS